jgi:hypothetical protein
VFTADLKYDREDNRRWANSLAGHFQSADTVPLEACYLLGLETHSALSKCCLGLPTTLYMRRVKARSGAAQLGR